MSRRLPLCAWCGASLRRPRGKLLLEYENDPGAPAIGWCLGCWRRDPACPVVSGQDRGLVWLVKAIEARGPGRVEWRRPSEREA